MSSIEVYSGLGNKRGKDVIDALLGNEVLLVRGQREINKYAYQTSSIKLSTIWNPNIKLRDIVEVSDITNNIPYLARVTGIEIKQTISDIEVLLSLEKVSE